MITARESARMMGVHIPPDTSEGDAQTLVGDAIERATAAAIAKRNLDYVLTLPRSRHPPPHHTGPRTCAPALASAPLPPPLLKKPDTPAPLMRGLTSSLQLAHELFAHASPQNTVESVRHYRMRQGRDPLRRCICDTSANMQRKRTTHVSRSTEDRSKTLTAHVALSAVGAYDAAV